jgi:hypothetical protein
MDSSDLLFQKTEEEGVTRSRVSARSRLCHPPGFGGRRQSVD